MIESAKSFLIFAKLFFSLQISSIPIKVKRVESIQMLQNFYDLASHDQSIQNFLYSLIASQLS